MNSFSRIIQLTDLHITAEGEVTKNGINTLERAALIFNTLRTEKHDLLLWWHLLFLQAIKPLIYG